jgi:hypothetical protein
MSGQADPLSALTMFYRAFNSADMDIMQKSWLNSAETSMSNPLGGLRRGWNEISMVYESIFNGPADVHVEFYDFTIHESDNMFCAVGRERGSITVDNKTIDLAIRTSRFYVLRDGLWLQLHHHGSIDKPAMLDQYQSLVNSINR